MTLCVGVAFKRVARSYWFDPGDIEALKEGERVVVETSRGPELGVVKISQREVNEDELDSALRPVLRRSEFSDLERERENRATAKNALEICNEKVKDSHLPMKLLQAETTFDGSQVTIYFAAEHRVDFRELVREVSTAIKCRVMLHQVGARDQAKLVGGVGPCGLTLCCASFLTEFAPVSMKMAKDQSLFLNPVKYSGVCGKLMCCLRYEYEDGEPKPPKLPSIGEVVRTPEGQGKMVDLNLSTNIATVELFETFVELNFPVSQITIEKTTKCADCRGCSLDDLKQDLEE